MNKQFESESGFSIMVWYFFAIPHLEFLRVFEEFTI
jgi:hypothetical protein